jgi:hypothetical protein
VALQPAVTAPNSFRIFDLILDCNFQLPELPRVETPRADLQVRLLEAAMPAPAPAPWIHHWLDADGCTTLSLAREGDCAVLRCPRAADFRVSADCRRVEIMAHPTTPAHTLRHLLLDQVLPRVVAQRGRPVLHASAVAVAGAAVAFAGPTGAGKSTLASWFHRQGCPLLTDDALVLETGQGDTRIIGSYSGSRLWDDSPALEPGVSAQAGPVAHYSDKLRVPGAGGGGQNLPLALLLIVTPGKPGACAHPGFTPLNGAAALMAMVENSFLLDIDDPGGGSARLGLLGRVVESGLRVFRLDYPHHPDALEAVLDLVRTFISSGVQPAALEA